jgi:hypothetical protein
MSWRFAEMESRFAARTRLRHSGRATNAETTSGKRPTAKTTRSEAWTSALALGLRAAHAERAGTDLVDMSEPYSTKRTRNRARGCATFLAPSERAAALASYKRSTTPAIAWPKPMHMAAMP